MGKHMRRCKNGEPAAFFNEALVYDGDECRLWPFASANGWGYGGWDRKDGRSTLVHKRMCEDVHGPQPSEHHEAAHTCGNRRCINPRHLRWATRTENESDKIGHGTVARGVRNALTKLTEEDVRAIFQMDGKQTEIGARFGVSQNAVSAIKTGVSWSWLTGQKRHG